MTSEKITRETFLADTQGRTFSDVLDDQEQPFDEVLQFFNDEDRQRRMEESEIHHDRSPLAGVVRELESQPDINQFLSEVHTRRSNRLRQAIGVVVRMVMEQRGWRKTGRKGSLGVRAAKSNTPSARHNSGGLAFWFIRGERYEQEGGMPYRSVRDRCEELDAIHPQDSSAGVESNVQTNGHQASKSTPSNKNKLKPRKTEQANRHIQVIR